MSHTTDLQRLARSRERRYRLRVALLWAAAIVVGAAVGVAIGLWS